MSDNAQITEIEKMSFEQALSQLEKVVSSLEAGDVALDRSIALYEQGALLKKRCEEELRRAEEKVSLITEAGPGEASGTKPFGHDG